MASEQELSILVKAKDGATAILRNVEKQFESLGRSMNSAGSIAGPALGKVGSGLKVVGLAAATGIGATVTAMGGLAAMGLKNAATLEQNRIAFTTMLGSGEAAGAMLKEISTFAATTPFELPGIQNASRSLLAFGLEQDKVIPSLKMIGDVASGVGAPLEDLALIYGKARTSGTLYAEDVNQLTERGIPIIAQLAEQFGVSQDKVKGLVSEGKVGFPELEKAFQSMTGEGGQFFNLMDAQSKSASGVISNLKDSFFQLSLAIVGVDPDGTIHPGGLFDQFKGILSTVLDWINKNRDQIIAFAQAAGGVLGAALTALYGFITGSLIPTFEKVWNKVKEIIDQWNNYEGLAGTLRSTLEYLATIIRDNLSGAWDVFGGIIKWVAIIIGGIVLAAFVGLVAAIAGAIKMANDMKNAYNIVVEFFKQIPGWFESVWNSIVSGTQNALAAVGEAVRAGMDWVLSSLNSIGSSISGAFSSLWNGISSAASSAFNAVVQTIKNAINTIIWGVNTAIGSINVLSEKASGLPGVNIPTLPTISYLAKGGIVTKPTLAMVGEDGPEAVIPLSRKNQPAGGIAGMGGDNSTTYNVTINAAPLDNINDVLNRMKVTLQTI